MTRGYRKAFSIVVPAITDSTVAFQEEKYLTRTKERKDFDENICAPGTKEPVPVKSR